MHADGHEAAALVNAWRKGESPGGSGATRVRNDLFDPNRGLDRGRPSWIEALWYVLKCVLFLTPWPVPSGVKCFVLRAFGARVGRGVVLKLLAETVR